MFTWVVGTYIAREMNRTDKDKIYIRLCINNVQLCIFIGDYTVVHHKHTSVFFEQKQGEKFFERLSLLHILHSHKHKLNKI